MSLNNSTHNKIERKKFFISIATLAAGFALLKGMPFNFINKKIFKQESVKAQMKNNLVRINPFAVTRNKIEKNDVRN